MSEPTDPPKEPPVANGGTPTPIWKRLEELMQAMQEKTTSAPSTSASSASSGLDVIGIMSVFAGIEERSIAQAHAMLPSNAGIDTTLAVAEKIARHVRRRLGIMTDPKT